MKLLGIFLTACVVLAAAQAAAVAIGVAMALGLSVALFIAPRDTLTILAGLVMLSVISAQPLASLGLLALLAILKAFAARVSQAAEPSIRNGSAQALLENKGDL